MEPTEPFNYHQKRQKNSSQPYRNYNRLDGLPSTTYKNYTDDYNSHPSRSHAAKHS